MKIFNEIEELRKLGKIHSINFSDEFCGGYQTALNDLEERLKRKIVVVTEE